MCWMMYGGSRFSLVLDQNVVYVNSIATSPFAGNESRFITDCTGENRLEIPVDRFPCETKGCG